MLNQLIKAEKSQSD